MEFFNKKQDVINLQLTQFGRYLLSQGIFHPEYYSFHDSDILYNNSPENQNDAQPRIKETPTIKPQISFYSLEKEHENLYGQIISGKEKIGSDALQKSAIKSYSFSSALGTMSPNSSHSPTFKIEFLKGEISGSSATLGNGVYKLELKDKNGGKNTTNITQIETDLEVVYVDIQNEDQDEDFYEYEDGSLEFGVVTKEDDMFMLLKVLENNTSFEKENFDIEVFEIIHDEGDDVTTETLRQLSFDEKIELDDAYDYPSEYIPERDASYVTHYFDVFVDDEIDYKIICQHDPDPQKDGVFANKEAKLCEDTEDGRTTFDIYEDETDYPGEVC